MDKGGACIFLKNNIKYETLDVNEFCEEGCCELVAVKLYLDHEQLLVIAGYRPPQYSHDIFLDQVCDCLNKYKKINMKTIMIGDFNIEISKQNFAANRFLTLMKSHGLRNTIKSYTREFKGSRTIIDLLFTDFEESEIRSEVVVSALSDHHAQIGTVSRGVTKNIETTKSRLTRVFSPSAKKMFKTLLSKENWREMYQAVDLNSKFNEFQSQLNYVFSVSFPQQIKKIKKHQTDKLILGKEMLELRQKVHDAYLLTKDLESSHYMRQHYRHIKNQFRQSIRQLKSAQVLDKINKADNKSKAVWGIINETKNKPKKHKNFTIINQDNQEITEPQKIADYLNDFFLKTGINSSNMPDNICKDYRSVNSLFLRQIDESEVLNIVHNMKNKKSAGSDELSPSLLKEIIDIVAKPLAHLINCSFQQGQFPNKLKTSVVRPIPKRANDHKYDNFRPVTIVSTISKIFEKAALIRLTDFLEKKEILFKNQFGFVKGKTTTNAMFCMTSAIVKALDSGNFTSGIFFDLSKAFDYVNHDLLLRKLNSIGVRGLALEWFTSYLQDRYQYVEVSGLDSRGCSRPYASSLGNIICGVPQGSVLGPVLFLLYINDLSSCIGDGTVCLFADDTSLTVSGSTRDDLEISSFVQSNSLLQWFDENLLKLNTEKSQFINFSIRTNDRNQFKLLLGDVEIESTHQTKFLGLTLDNNVRFHAHVDTVCRRVSSSIFLLRQLSKIAEINVLMTAYYGSLYPHLVYAVPIWGCENKRTLFLFRLQKKAIRVIHGLDHRQSCRNIFRSSRILTFPSIYILETLSFVKNNLHHFNSQRSQFYSLRNNNNLNIPAHSTAFFQRQCLYGAVKLYNLLPLNLKLESNPAVFKKLLKNVLVEKCYYSVRECITDGFGVVTVK